METEKGGQDRKIRNFLQAREFEASEPVVMSVSMSAQPDMGQCAEPAQGASVSEAGNGASSSSANAIALPLFACNFKRAWRVSWPRSLVSRQA